MVRASVLCVIGFSLASVLGGCSSSTAVRELYNKPTGVIQEDDDFLYLANTNREGDQGRGSIWRRNSGQNETLPASVNRDKFLIEVVHYLGVPYSFGGSTSQGVDCSGYVCKVFYAALGKKLPRSTNEQFAAGERIRDYNLRFGDLVFFNTTGQVPSHVGIYIEDGLFAHASVSGGVTFSSMDENYYKRRYVGARRFIQD